MAGKSLLKSVGVIVLLGVVLPKGQTLQAQSSITIVEHGPFTEMLEKYREINTDPNRRLAGYRVQIMATTDRLKLEEAERKFESLFRYPVEWKHEPPYYKLRTGAFTDRAAATSYLYKVKRHFPSAYPAMVKDIKPAELLQYRD